MYLYFSLKVEQRNKGEPRPVVACCLTRSAFCSTPGTGGTGRNGHIWSLGRTRVCYGCLPTVLHMATSASQPYIAKLGFQDPDRNQDRHGLACEYLFDRLLDLEIVPEWILEKKDHASYRLSKCQKDYEHKQSQVDGYEWGKDSVYFQGLQRDLEIAVSNLASAKQNPDLILSAASAKDQVLQSYKPALCINRPIQGGYSYKQTVGFADVWVRNILGEVKITKQSAESVLQQINFYQEYVNAAKVYILTDYDCSALQRLTEGSDIKVFRLGKRFDDWIASRSMPSTPEL